MKKSLTIYFVIFAATIFLSGISINAQTVIKENPATKSNAKPNAPNSYYNRDKADEPGFYNITEFGWGAGLEESSEPFSGYFYGLTTMAGYKWNSSFLTAIGVGYHGYNDGTHIPVFADVRYLFGKSESRPFLNVQGGYLLKNDPDFDKARYYVNPMLGMHFSIKQKAAFMVSAGVFSQWLVQVEDRRDSFFTLKLGMMFK